MTMNSALSLFFNSNCLFEIHRSLMELYILYNAIFALLQIALSWTRGNNDLSK